MSTAPAAEVSPEQEGVKTEPAWTPGPWTTKLDIASGNRGFGVVSRASQFAGEDWPYHPLIATVYRGFGQAPREVAEANASLIAAGPEMYEALNCWPLTLILEAIQNSTDQKLRHTARLFIEVRDAACAKARGERS